jgi:hypothetical protein
MGLKVFGVQMDIDISAPFSFRHRLLEGQKIVHKAEREF